MPLLYVLHPMDFTPTHSGILVCLGSVHLHLPAEFRWWSLEGGNGGHKCREKGVCERVCVCERERESVCVFCVLCVYECGSGLSRRTVL